RHAVAAPPRPRAYGGDLPPDAPVRDERMSVELIAEETFQKGRSLRFRGAVHTGGPPRFVAALDDEGRAIRAVLIRVHAPEAVIVVLEIERERRKRPRRAQPDESIRPDVQGGLYAIVEEPADRAVAAVGCDD